MFPFLFQCASICPMETSLYLECPMRHQWPPSSHTPTRLKCPSSHSAWRKIRHRTRHTKSTCVLSTFMPLSILFSTTNGQKCIIFMIQTKVRVKQSLIFYYEWTKVYYIYDSDEGKRQSISIQCQRACSVRSPWCLSFGLGMVVCTI